MNMELLRVLVDILLVITNLSIIGLIITHLLHNKTKNKNNDFKTQLLSQDGMYKKVEELMHTLIQNALNSYVIFNMDPDLGKVYIKEKEQKVMISAITNRIISTMTESEKELLSLVYKMDTEEDKKETVKFEVSLVVLEFVISVNKDKKE